MAITRTNAAARLAGTLSVALADAGIPLTDSSPGLASAIDDAFLMTGSAYDTLTTATFSGSALQFFLVLDYAAKIQIYNAWLNRVSASKGDPSVSAQRQQATQEVKRAMDTAYLRAEPFIIGGSDGFSAGTIGIDFIEPWPVFS